MLEFPDIDQRNLERSKVLANTFITIDPAVPLTTIYFSIDNSSVILTELPDGYLLSVCKSNKVSSFEYDSRGALKQAFAERVFSGIYIPDIPPSESEGDLYIAKLLPENRVPNMHGQS